LENYGIECSVWSQGVFDLGEHVLDGLVRKAKTVDFAILVLSPDDHVESRNAESQAPRDNVVFELGLFIGALGKDRTYMVHPDGVSLKLPSVIVSSIFGPRGAIESGPRFTERCCGGGL
jgi:predicted nucleotide-binding protein